MEEQGEVTRLLAGFRSGDAAAEERLLSLVYDELRRLARGAMADERRNHTLQPTALVHEAYLRLIGLQRIDFASRQHFLAVAGRLMREILVDHARRKRAAKRGGDAGRVTLRDDLVGVAPGPLDLLDLDAALAELARIDERRARVVELRCFAGLTLEEAAAALDVSPRTAKRLWRGAKAWLASRLGAEST